MEDALYGQGQRELETGDLLAMYTDGIVEAPNPEGVEFGEDRLVEVLRRHESTNLDSLVLVVMDELSRWTHGAAAHDDATLVLVRAT
jgi:sigma-B regulation protein RsbU (phosphoserine phosphatase)